MCVILNEKMVWSKGLNPCCYDPNQTHSASQFKNKNKKELGDLIFYITPVLALKVCPTFRTCSQNPM